jgi:hypothetical protein
MRLRLAALTALAALAATALPGQAAGPQISGDGGDMPVPNLDIVSAQFATKGTTTKVGRKTVYTPKSLVVTVTYSGAPDALPVASQYVAFTLSSCGAVLMQRYDANGTYGTAECLGDETLAFDAVATGSTVVFTLPFNVIGKQFKRGSTLTDLRTLTGVAEPVVGLGPVDVLEELSADSAGTDATYKVA